MQPWRWRPGLFPVTAAAAEPCPLGGGSGLKQSWAMFVYWQNVLQGARPPVMLLLPLLLLPLQAGRASGSPRSVFRTTYTAVSAPGPGLPQFTAAAYVDDLPIARYDSNTGKVWNQAAWMERLLELHPAYQDKYEKMLQQDKADFTAGLGAVQATHNQSAGFHTWQMMAGCEVGLDRPRGRYLRFGYDGRDFLSLEVETFNWTAADATAQKMKRSWEANPSVTRRFRAYVEETCAEWSQAWLFYGKEIVRSKEPPEVTVTRRAGQDDTEMLTCRAHGFYPREIDMAWTRDGEVWLQDASRGVLAPNSDGTFYAWISIRIEPWDRVRFLCRVEHDALQTPVELAWEEPGSILGPIIGLITGVLVLLPGIVLAVLYLKALRGAYGPASEIIQGSYRVAKQRLQEGYEEARQVLQESYEEAEGMLVQGHFAAMREFGDYYTAAKQKLKKDLRKKFGKLGISYRVLKWRLDDDCQAARRRLEDDYLAIKRRLRDDYWKAECPCLWLCFCSDTST